MLLDALSATAHDLVFGLLAAVVLLVLGYLLIRSDQKEQARCKVYIEETVPSFQWPPRPKPAVAPERHLGKTRVGL